MRLNPEKQHGASLFDVLIGIGIGIPVLFGLYYILDNFLLEMKLQNAAQYQKSVSDEYAKYVKDNFAALAAVATAAVPERVTFATLQAAGFAQTLQNTNPFGQTPCAIMLEPNPNQLQVIIFTEGGQDIPKHRAKHVANMMGASGGYIKTGVPDTAEGAFGQWRLDVTNYRTTNCSGTVVQPEHMASSLFFDNGYLIQNYLYRTAVPGHPEANQMLTDLDMDGNDISNINYAIFDSAEVVNGVCVTPKTVATDATGKLLSCDTATMTWKRQGSLFWEDPVATFAALPACNADSISVTRVVETPTVGTGRRAYSCNGAGTWQALAVDNSGNMVVPNSLSVGGGVTANSVTANSVSSSGNISAGGNLAVSGNSTFSGNVGVLGNLNTSAGSMTNVGNININGTAGVFGNLGVIGTTSVNNLQVNGGTIVNSITGGNAVFDSITVGTLNVAGGYRDGSWLPPPP